MTPSTFYTASALHTPFLYTNEEQADCLHMTMRISEFVTSYQSANPLTILSVNQ